MRTQLLAVEELAARPGDATTARLLAAAEDLGLPDAELAALAASWREQDCRGAHRRLSDAVAARLAVVQEQLADSQHQAVEAGPGSDAWVDATRASLPGYQDAARLQAVDAALDATGPAGTCGDGCGCATALAAPATAYHFPAGAGRHAGSEQLRCDLQADGGAAEDRVALWQQVLDRVLRRDRLPEVGDGTQAGIVLRFDPDPDLAAALARLAAAEYHCCSFGSYTIVVDAAGLRLEIRMPADAAASMASVVGVPDGPEPPGGVTTGGGPAVGT